MRILMVCLGNICRSPMAEGILRTLASQQGLDWHVDSAGTGAWHTGEAPDPRAIAVCRQRGLDIRQLRARQFRTRDFEEFDLILTMDRDNHRRLMMIAKSVRDQEKVRQIMSYTRDGSAEVPDPYYDGRFEEVYELLEGVCARIIEALSTQRKDQL